MKQEIFERYVDIVCENLHITREELFSPSRVRTTTDARHMLYYLCYTHPIQITYIKKYLKDNGYNVCHTSIVRGVASMKKKMFEDADYLNIVNKLKRIK